VLNKIGVNGVGICSVGTEYLPKMAVADAHGLRDSVSLQLRTVNGCGTPKMTPISPAMPCGPIFMKASNLSWISVINDDTRLL